MTNIPKIIYNYSEHIQSIMAKGGLFPVIGTIGDEHAHRLMAEMLLSPAKSLTVILNSPGGSLYGALALHDAIKAGGKSGRPTTIITMGLSASAACMVVLQAADHRLTYPNTRFMVHELARRGEINERQSETADIAREMKHLQEHILNLMSKRMGRPVSFLTALIRRKSTWLAAEEALEAGLVDAITEELPTLG